MDFCAYDSSFDVDGLAIVFGNINFSYCSKGSGRKRETVLVFNGVLEIQQGTLAMIVGPPSEGKTTVLKLLGGALIPSLTDLRPDSRYFVPSHLHLLHVSGYLFFEGTLMANLTFGIHEELDDGNTERVISVLRRVGCTDDVVQYVNDALVLDWSDVFSGTQLELLSIARALVANPEVLVLHKPFAAFDNRLAQHLVGVIREFIDQRGISAPDAYSARRPRTCIMTRADTRHIDVADCIFYVGRDGIRPMSAAEAVAIEHA